MHSTEAVQVVLSLLEEGENHREASLRTGIPISTIAAWSRGRLPRRAREASDGIVACRACGWPAHDFAALPGAAYAYLLGIYLGDGYIAKHARRVFALRIFLDRAYPGIVEESLAAMSEVLPRNSPSVRHHPSENLDMAYSYSRQWPCLLPQHGAGKKHERRIELTDWQLEITSRHPGRLLRGLIHSDGWRGMNVIRHPRKTYAYPRYQFFNHSDDIRQIFCCHLDRLGIDWRQMNATTISIARRDAVARLDEFIGPKE